MTTHPPHPLALIVEDSAPSSGLLAALARRRGFDVVTATTTEAGAQVARARRPDLLLLGSDLCSNGGMGLLQRVREEDPTLPIVLIADVDTTMFEEALRLGAVDFLTRPLVSAEAAFVLDKMYLALYREADLSQVFDVLVERRTRLSFPGRPAYLSKIVAYLGREVRNTYPRHEVPVTEVKLALYEALANAIEHGNLEITYAEKTRAMSGGAGMEPLIRERLADPRLAGRKVHLEATYTPAQASYRIRDEGPGFVPKDFERQRLLADATALHGRGLALIAFYTDEVAWNETGNEIHMVKRIA